ncbi:MAG TPA: AraC family transcriptional regulator [Terriglobia bacterium]|nr:AraC family transcriptional regulator [Terriglobia bacterium]
MSLVEDSSSHNVRRSEILVPGSKSAVGRKALRVNTMDVLTDVLQVVRLSGAVIFVAEFSSPWVIESPPSNRLAAFIMPRAECFTIFHVLAEGTCWVKVEGEPPLRMVAGDVLVVPQGDEHVMGSDLALKPTPMKVLIPQIPWPGMPPVIHGGGGEVARFVCGYLHCDQKFNPLFSTLPRLLCVRSREGGVVLEPAGAENKFSHRSVPFHAGMWLNTTLYYLVKEAQAQSSSNQLMLARLTELMFVEVLRHYMQELAPDQRGWLAGLKDPYVNRAITMLHAQPARAWTVEDLARDVGVSRSALAGRFTALIGESPMRYLAGWRIHLAKQLLCEGHHSLAEVAERVGYESEYAFNRAFKRRVGKPPAAWRKKASALRTAR